MDEHLLFNGILRFLTTLKVTQDRLEKNMNLLVTGGCGFIGSNFIDYVIEKKQIYRLVNVDCLSYAGSLDNTKKFENHPLVNKGLNVQLIGHWWF